jgi:hypothetical protein
VADNTCFLQGEEFFFGDVVFFRVQPTIAVNTGAALPVSM